MKHSSTEWNTKPVLLNKNVLGKFDLKKYLVENKLTRISRLLEEAFVSAKGDIGGLDNPLTTNNAEFDESLDSLIELTQKLTQTKDLASTLNYLLKFGWSILVDIQNDKLDDDAYTNLYVETAQLLNSGDLRKSIEKFRDHLTKLETLYTGSDIDQEIDLPTQDKWGLRDYVKDINTGNPNSGNKRFALRTAQQVQRELDILNGKIEGQRYYPGYSKEEIEEFNRAIQLIKNEYLALSAAEN